MPWFYVSLAGTQDRGESIPNSARFGGWVTGRCFGLRWKEKRARPSGKDTNRAPGQFVSPVLGP